MDQPGTVMEICSHEDQVQSQGDLTPVVGGHNPTAGVPILGGGGGVLSLNHARMCVSKSEGNGSFVGFKCME